MIISEFHSKVLLHNLYFNSLLIEEESNVFWSTLIFYSRILFQQWCKIKINFFAVDLEVELYNEKSIIFGKMSIAIVR